MIRVLHRLTTTRIKTAPAGLWADGGNLYLQVTAGADDGLRRSWIFRYAINGKEHQMGLGPTHTIGLTEARQEATELRKLLYRGQDPLHQRKAARASTALETAKATTFRVAAKRLIASKRKGWKNAKHAAQWGSTLETYAYPVIGDLPVQAVDTGLVMKVLDPIWSTKTETASRVRSRIEAVIGSAKAYGEYVGENPARWKGNLDAILAKTSDVATKTKQPSLPYEQMPEFMMDLRAREGIAAAALEFQIMTATRPGNVARWSEIDVEAGVWTVPPEKMKGGKEGGDEHKVPLSAAALAVIERMAKIRNSEFVFYSVDTGDALSDAAMRALIARMNASNVKVGRAKWIDPKSKRTIVPHGFRSSFRTWVSEETTFQREIAEKALAHQVGDETERAYDRGDLFAKRRELMAAWAEYCNGTFVRKLF